MICQQKRRFFCVARCRRIDRWAQQAGLCEPWTFLFVELTCVVIELSPRPSLPSCHYPLQKEEPRSLGWNTPGGESSAAQVKAALSGGVICDRFLN